MTFDLNIVSLKRLLDDFILFFALQTIGKIRTRHIRRKYIFLIGIIQESESQYVCDLLEEKERDM